MPQRLSRQVSCHEASNITASVFSVLIWMGPRLPVIWSLGVGPVSRQPAPCACTCFRVARSGHPLQSPAYAHRSTATKHRSNPAKRSHWALSHRRNTQLNHSRIFQSQIKRRQTACHHPNARSNLRPSEKRPLPTTSPKSKLPHHANL